MRNPHANNLATPITSFPVSSRSPTRKAINEARSDCADFRRLRVIISSTKGFRKRNEAREAVVYFTVRVTVPVAVVVPEVPVTEAVPCCSPDPSWLVGILEIRVDARHEASHFVLIVATHGDVADNAEAIDILCMSPKIEAICILVALRKSIWTDKS